MNSNLYSPMMNMPTRGEFDVMLSRYSIPASSYPMDMQIFNRYFGQYYNPSTGQYTSCAPACVDSMYKEYWKEQLSQPLLR